MKMQTNLQRVTASFAHICETYILMRRIERSNSNSILHQVFTSCIICDKINPVDQRRSITPLVKRVSCYMKSKKHIYLRNLLIFMLLIFYVPVTFNHLIYIVRGAESDLRPTKHFWLQTANFSPVMQDSDGRIYVDAEYKTIKINEDESLTVYNVDNILNRWLKVVDGDMVFTSNGTIYRYAQDGTFLSAHDAPADQVPWEGSLYSTTNYAERNGIGYETRHNSLFSYVIAYNAKDGSDEHIVLWAVHNRIGVELTEVYHFLTFLIAVLYIAARPPRQQKDRRSEKNTK